MKQTIIVLLLKYGGELERFPSSDYLLLSRLVEVLDKVFHQGDIGPEVQPAATVSFGPLQELAYYFPTAVRVAEEDKEPELRAPEMVASTWVPIEALDQVHSTVADTDFDIGYWANFHIRVVAAGTADMAVDL